jgi:hypothetical protein
MSGFLKLDSVISVAYEGEGIAQLAWFAAVCYNNQVKEYNQRVGDNATQRFFSDRRITEQKRRIARWKRIR